MANKYLIHGATFNGDGTSSAEATINGGAGAWNNINIFQGTAPTYGTLAAGDVVYIRSKSAAGSDIAVTTAVALSIGSAAATETAPITWVIDPGVVWPGVSGTVRYDSTASVSITIRDWNNIQAKNNNMVLGSTYTTASERGAVVLGTGWTDEVHIDLSLCTWALVSFVNGVHRQLSVTVLKRAKTLFRSVWTSARSLTLYSPEIEIIEPGLVTDGIFSTNASGASGQDPITIYGGRVYGSGATQGVIVTTENGLIGGFRSFGFQYPKEMPLSGSLNAANNVSVYADGTDGEFGSELYHAAFNYTSRSDNNPPTLSATLETSGGGAWSYRLYPHTVSSAKPARLSLSKTWTQAPAVQTITQEILWPTTMPDPSKGDVYVLVQYTDAATGLPKTISTRDVAGGTLSTSTAAWSATTWGMVALDKYKLSVTTPTAIKQDTAVIVSLFVTTRSATVNDVLFVDPDPTFSTP